MCGGSFEQHEMRTLLAFSPFKPPPRLHAIMTAASLLNRVSGLAERGEITSTEKVGLLEMLCIISSTIENKCALLLLPVEASWELRSVWGWAWEKHPAQILERVVCHVPFHHGWTTFLLSPPYLSPLPIH